jgi:hypothetical protein
LKSKAYSRHPVDLNAIKQATQDETVNNSEETLQVVKSSFSTLAHLCIHKGGGHLNDTEHKM